MISNHGLHGLASLTFAIFGMAWAAVAAEPTILVSARQRYPWNGLVDLNFTITGDAGTKYDTSFTAKDMVGNTNIAMRTIRKADGTTAAAKEQLLPGTYNWVWDTAADLNVDNISYASFVSTNNAVLFRNRSLSAVSRYSVVFGGTSIPHIARGACIIKADGVGKALQFQHNDGTYLKCVCVHLEQSGNDITGYVKWARYMSGAYDIGTDFDGASYSTMRVAASNDESGYGVANLSLSYPNPQAGWRSDRVRVAGSANGFYSVKFNANGGSGTMANESFTYGTARVLMPNAFTRTGYTFHGWATSASGAKVYNDKQSVLNLTQTSGAVVNLYAVWNAITYSVKFNANGGTGSMANESFIYGTAKALTANAFTRTGYTFQGWATSASGAKVYNDKQSVLNLTQTSGAVVNLYAVWDHEKVQLWANGPYWATINVGASKTTDSGYFFWWGDTIGYKRQNNKWVASDGSSSSFSFSSSNVPTYGKTFAKLYSGGWTTTSSESSAKLVTKHDAARAHWGGSWRMPTRSDISGITEKCTKEWTTVNGVKGYIVRGKGGYANKSIFFPATGYGNSTSLANAGSDIEYWLSNPSTGGNYGDYGTESAYSFPGSIYYNNYRYYGRPIRPVCSP